ncbi:MAG TPA: DUF4350 domain-containing protein [Mycobacteriales bacterium]|nr:DUF4350 domain-containing protein [Mycobacteriales bacterium]
MTLVDETVQTVEGPTVRTVARGLRGPVVAVLLLALAALLAFAAAATGSRKPLDPESFTPAGARAVAELLRDRGVAVHRVQSATEVLARRSAGSLVVVPFPGLVSTPDLEQLAELPLLLIAPEPRELGALGAAVDIAGESDVEVRDPDCSLAAAERAGDVHLGGLIYIPSGAAEATGCYDEEGFSLLHLPAQQLTVVGSGDFLTNEGLDERGNAALALGLLGGGSDVLWLLPRPGSRDPEAGDASLSELLPDSLVYGVAGLALAVVVLALWRARRLGPVVTEPLPVVVRAAETVEGRGRLYQAARARGTAAEQLRAGLRDRLARRLGLPPGESAAGVVAAVVARVDREPSRVHDLLYGAAPEDDAKLVRLAADLSALEEEVAAS